MFRRSALYKKAFGSSNNGNDNFNTFHLPEVSNTVNDHKMKNGKSQELNDKDCKKLKMVDDDEEEDSTYREKKMKALNKKIEDYVTGFTVHGLTRVLTAPRKESVFWLISLATGLLISIIVVNGLARKYVKYEV